MSDAVPLPPQPNLDQYRKLAKDLKHACESTDPAAVHEWAIRWIHTLARLRGETMTAAHQRSIAREAERLDRRWRDWRQSATNTETCRLTDAQFFIAREHGFASWPKFVAHLDALTREASPVSAFEAAADAIVDGDAATLATLLRKHPQLVHERSTRDHRSTLLHYVSANGVEDFRQKTPKNIIEMTTILLDAGADVNAESDAYAGGSTTLGLVATSIHPEQAGVQIPLLDLLIRRGSRLDQPSAAGNAHSVLAGCFANGQPEAARYLASRGAPIDLESAAALGDLGFVRGCLDEHGNVKPPAHQRQLKSAFVNACGYGAENVVRFLLERGINPRTDPDVRSSLPWAIYGRRIDMVKLLLQHGVEVNGRYERAQVRPLELVLSLWARSDDEDRQRYYDIVKVLVAHGGSVDPEWFKQDDRRREIAETVRRDPRILDALGEEVASVFRQP